MRAQSRLTAAASPQSGPAFGTREAVPCEEMRRGTDLPQGALIIDYEYHVTGAGMFKNHVLLLYRLLIHCRLPIHYYFLGAVCSMPFARCRLLGAVCSLPFVRCRYRLFAFLRDSWQGSPLAK